MFTISAVVLACSGLLSPSTPLPSPSPALLPAAPAGALAPIAPLSLQPAVTPSDPAKGPPPEPANDGASTSAYGSPLYACACGCGVFEVGTSAMLPHDGHNGMVWQDFAFQDQKHNRSGASSAPQADNSDREIRTYFFTTGIQYFFTQAWGAQLEVPFDTRHFASTDGTWDWTALGDIRLKAIYAGFLDDRSLGIDFGVKLPTGNFTHDGPDRDTEIGTGSTDILVGGFYQVPILSSDFSFFTQVEGDVPVFTRDQYHPGVEVDGSLGVFYSGFHFGDVTVAPIGQVILSYRSSDTGDNASSDPVSSGYRRVLLSPGVEVDYGGFSFYADVEVPVYQYYNGYQLAASEAFKFIVAYHF
jgi:hypothetical protein